MRNRSSLLVAVAVAGWLIAVVRAAPQFETPNRAFHNATMFRLEGRHLTVPCESCHINGQFAGTPKTCYECHWVRRKDDRFQTRLGTQCEQCHRPTSWSAVTFNHGSTAGIPLNVDHRQLSCDACHKSADVRAGSVVCITCHRRDYDATKSPAHAAAGFPTACEACHQPGDASWMSRGGFSHAAVFPLVGVHATATCTACHKNNVYKGTPRDCIGCHQTDYNRTQTPNHAAAGFPTTCDACHRASDPQWRGVNFNHSSFFPLVGVHATQTCVACHRNNVYKGTPRECIGCHQADFNRTSNPNHANAGFSTACESCHRPTDPQWQGAGFNHAAVFALVGVHATQPCTACHKNNVFKGTPRDCIGCHQADYNRTSNPNHATAGFPTTCDSCHKPTDPQWQGAGFNHAAVFPLVGVHTTQACAACHKNNVFRGTPRDCVGCHQAEYNRTTTPNHPAAGFPTTCDSCHRATDPNWLVASFNHGTFPLLGVHATQPCARCHVNNVYRGTPRTCVGCHQTDYNRTANPNHAAAGFPTTCETCHKATDSTWQQGTFSHTAFPLSGPHNVTCAQCHTTPNNFATFNCLVCHARATTDSHHTGVNGYRYDSQACYACHPNGRH